MIAPDDDDFAASRAKFLTLAPSFLDVAACPACHAKLAIDYGAEALACTGPACGLIYPVRDGIPILLIDEAQQPTVPQGGGW